MTLPAKDLRPRRWAGWVVAVAGVLSLVAAQSTLAVTWLVPVAESVRGGDRLGFDNSRKLPEVDVTPWWAPSGYPYGLDHLGVVLVVVGALGVLVAPVLRTRCAATSVGRAAGPIIAAALLLSSATSVYLVLRLRNYWQDRIATGGGFRFGPAFWTLSAAAALAAVALGLYASTRTDE
ncbi:hypothetical protein [Nocardia brasiliensis]|uniref:hypothetical protein n=1 Tax=Nocardia brasiliensis TaxID=37326 RepID=UPI000AF408C3|nr:hypothetical protein [Nocardia brasiliensis]